MSRWVDGWLMDEWQMGGNGQMTDGDGWMMDGCVGGWMERWMIDGCINEQRDG